MLLYLCGSIYLDSPFMGTGFSGRNQGFKPMPTAAGICDNSKAAPKTGCARHDASSLPVWKWLTGPGRGASSRSNVAAGRAGPHERRYLPHV